MEATLEEQEVAEKAAEKFQKAISDALDSEPTLTNLEVFRKAVRDAREAFADAQRKLQRAGVHYSKLPDDDMRKLEVVLEIREAIIETYREIKAAQKIELTEVNLGIIRQNVENARKAYNAYEVKLKNVTEVWDSETYYNDDDNLIETENKRDQDVKMAVERKEMIADLQELEADLITLPKIIQAQKAVEEARQIANSSQDLSKVRQALKKAMQFYNNVVQVTGQAPMSEKLEQQVKNVRAYLEQVEADLQNIEKEGQKQQSQDVDADTPIGSDCEDEKLAMPKAVGDQRVNPGPADIRNFDGGLEKLAKPEAVEGQQINPGPVDIRDLIIVGLILLVVILLVERVS